MTADSDGMREVFSSMAAQIRREEKRRTWRLVVGVSVLTLILFALMIRMQQNDHRLRESLVKQCEARNITLELQRQHYQKLVISTELKEREIWAATLSQLPPSQNCAEYRDPGL